MEERFDGLQEHVSQLSERIAASGGDQRELLRRVSALESNDRQQSGMNVTIQRQADAIEALQEKVNALAEQLHDVARRVAEIEKEPGERWKKISFEIIKYIVLAAVGAAIGYLMK